MEERGTFSKRKLYDGSYRKPRRTLPKGHGCTVCQHNKLPAINRDLIFGMSMREAGEKYGMKKDAMHRHNRTCIDEAQKRKIVADDIRSRELAEHQGDAKVINDQSGEIEKELRWCLKKVREVVERAEESEDDPLVLAGAKEMRAALVDLAKLLGVLKRDLHVTVSLTDSSPEWLALRSILVQVFRNHPDAERQFVELAKPLRITDGRHLT